MGFLKWSFQVVYVVKLSVQQHPSNLEIPSFVKVSLFLLSYFGLLFKSWNFWTFLGFSPHFTSCCFSFSLFSHVFPRWFSSSSKYSIEPHLLNFLNVHHVLCLFLQMFRAQNPCGEFYGCLAFLHLQKNIYFYAFMAPFLPCLHFFYPSYFLV